MDVLLSTPNRYENERVSLHLGIHSNSANRHWGMGLDSGVGPGGSSAGDCGQGTSWINEATGRGMFVMNLRAHDRAGIPKRGLDLAVRLETGTEVAGAREP